EVVEGDDAVHGYTEKLTAPTVEFTLSHTAQTSLKTLHDLIDTTVTFETDTGKSYIMRNAWTSEPPELTGGGGEVTMKMAGITCEES
ncbi:MAG: phage tail tube protein, partial [Methylococcaceae bacterium]|nr:phage tail tube protein [Methylococcaceae bacterium]